MSRLLSRLVLALATALAAPVVYTGSYIVIEQTLWRRDLYALHAANFLTATLFVLAWIGIWHSQVVWTRARRLLTAASVLWSVGAAFIFGVVVAVCTQGNEVGVILGGMVWFVAWMASTAFVWRETGPERAARLGSIAKGTVSCLNCGYNLTGLHEARCPECGTQYTLDELFASLADDAKDLGQE